MDLYERLASYVPTVLVVSVVYCASVSFYRIFLHPLAKVPGPWPAATSHLVEFYYDVLRDGQYIAKIKEWHGVYGPILRIGPNEVHCNDPMFIDQIYAGSGSGKKRDKTVRFSNAIGVTTAGLCTIPHDLHRQRRAVLNKYFSAASIRNIEPFIKERLQKVCYHLDNYYSREGNAANLSDALSCVAIDVVSEFVFGFSYNYSDSPSFLPNINSAIDGSSSLNHLAAFFPWVLKLLNMIPQRIILKISPDLKAMLEYKTKLEHSVDTVRDEASLNAAKKSRMGATIFTEMLQSDLPESEKTKQRFNDEAFALIGAGTETVSTAASIGSYYLLTQPGILDKLLLELEHNIPDPDSIPDWVTLEQLPYLGAVIQESLRLSYGIVTRLERVPHEPLAYHCMFKDKHVDLVIPAGTIIGMSNGVHHHNEDIFPGSYSFIPERWLEENGKRKRELDAQLLSFSKGSRQCIGINLAYAEMHLFIATLFRRFGRRMRLVDTSKSEVTLARDHYLPKRESNTGVRVCIGSA